MSDNVHATCIAVGGRAVLLRGPSGAGKSDLALRALGLDGAAPLHMQVRLVADDRTQLRRSGHSVLASPPPAIAGKLEVRGIGIVDLPYLSEAPVSLLVDLRPSAGIDRLPHSLACEDVLGVSLPVLALDPFELSAPVKLLLAINTYAVAASP